MVGIQQGIDSPVEVGRRTVESFAFPNWMAQSFNFIHKVHFFGRTWIRFQRRVESPALYLGGAFLNQQLGDSTVIRVTAQIVLIARILLEAFEDGATIIRSWNAYAQTLEGTDSMTYSYLAEGLSNPGWSREEGRLMGELFFSEKIAIVAHRVYLVVTRFFHFISAVAKLSFRLLELYDAIMIDPFTQAAAIDDLLIELAYIGDHVGGDRCRLERAVEMYKPMINKTLDVLCLNWTADGLTKKLGDLAEYSIGIRKVYRNVEDVACNAGRGASAIAESLLGTQNIPELPFLG